MKLCFDSIEELKIFVASLKGTRGKKGEGDDGEQQTGTTAPAPLQPPQGGNAGVAFNPSQQQQPTFQPPTGGAFPGGPTGDPAVAGLVQRIGARIDGAIASGQPADAVLTWFRGECGAEAAGVTMDQIKQVFLPKMPLPKLENIAKLMNA